MPTKYRRQFDIDLTDLEMIEHALRDKAKQLSLEKLNLLENNEVEAVSPYQPDPELMAIQSVLGKLHNQKIWYTPQEYVPRG